MSKLIPVLSEPTPEQHRKASSEWYARAKGTFLDELPSEILHLSVPTTFYDFDVTGLLNGFDGDLTEAKRLASEMSSQWDWNLMMCKLCSRSPKDAWDNGGLTVSAVQGVSWLLSSMRILEDLVEFRHLIDRKPPTICVREPFFGQAGPRTWEFRAFVKDGELIAVTDYDYHNPNPALSHAGQRGEIRREINRFFQTYVSPSMDLTSYVFDLVFQANDKITLIEINPYGLSDPCFLQTYKAVESFCGDIAWEYEAQP